MRQINGSTRLTALEAVALDTETTGLDTRKARMVQIAAVGICGGSVSTDENLSLLVDPGEPIPRPPRPSTASATPWWLESRVSLRSGPRSMPFATDG